MTTQQIREKTVWAKRKVLEMCVHANLGHLTTAYSCAEIVATLYYGVMRLDPKNPKWENRDRFIMSKNHGSVMIYPVLADLGYFAESELETFMDDGTRLGGHSKLCLEGVDFAGGSLGIGLGVAAGLAYSAKLSKKDWLTFTIVGDGESYEGSIWEAAMFASHNKLNNLVVILDKNGMCCTDFTKNILDQEPMREKWQAFGWDTEEIDGHNLEQLSEVFRDIRERSTPLCIIANTVKGNGIEFMSNAPLMHGAAPPKASLELAYAQFEEAHRI